MAGNGAGGRLGVDEAALARAVQRIIDIDPSAQRAWLIHSMAIAYRGKLSRRVFLRPRARDAARHAFGRQDFSSVMLGGAMLGRREDLA